MASLNLFLRLPLINFKLINRYCSRSTVSLHLQKYVNKRCDKIPLAPVYEPIAKSQLPPKTSITKETIEHLEKLSLVDFANPAGIKRLEESIEFADQLSVVDTTGIEPLVTVLENRNLFLREDQITEGNCREQILSSAVVTEEDYFVAPPGNIPLAPDVDHYFSNELPEKAVS